MVDLCLCYAGSPPVGTNRGYPLGVVTGCHCAALLLQCAGYSSCGPQALEHRLNSCARAQLGFPGGSAGKESACNVGDLGSIPGLGRSPGEGKGYPLQYSGLENSMDCIVHGITKGWTRLSNLNFHGLSCSTALGCSWTRDQTCISASSAFQVDSLPMSHQGSSWKCFKVSSN